MDGTYILSRVRRNEIVNAGCIEASSSSKFLDIVITIGLLGLVGSVVVVKTQFSVFGEGNFFSPVV